MSICICIICAHVKCHISFFNSHPVTIYLYHVEYERILFMLIHYLAMKMMMSCPRSFNTAVVTTFPMVVSYCFTGMHLCPIFVLVDEIVIGPFVLDI